MRDVADTFGRMKGTSMGKLLSALFNALTYSFFLRLFLGTAMFCGRLKRRKHFWINMTACFTAYFLIVNLFLPINVHGVFARTVLCVGWFLVALLWLLACFDEPIPILLFCSLAGYTTQQLAGSVNVLTVSFLQNIGVSTYPPQFDDPVYMMYCLRRAVKNYTYSMLHSNLINGLSSNTMVVSITPWWQITLYVFIGVSAVLTVGALAMLILSKTVFTKKKS